MIALAVNMLNIHKFDWLKDKKKRKQRKMMRGNAWIGRMWNRRLNFVLVVVRSNHSREHTHAPNHFQEKSDAS